VHFAWPYDIDPPALATPMTFIPHDFTYTHEFGVANYRQHAWIAIREAHERWLASDTPVVSSAFIAGELRRAFPAFRGDVHVIYLSSLNPLPAAGIEPAIVEELRRKHSLPACFMLCANNIMPHKNLGTLISALWHLRQAGSDLKLVACGVETEESRARVTGPLYADRTESRDDWDMRGLGLVSDDEVLALMRAATLVINPSLCEAGSGSGLDAWGCGCPVALSDIPAFRDQVGFLGTRAEFFDPRDPREIPEAERRAVRDQHVDSRGDQIPLGLDLLASRQVERPVVELRLPGRAPDPQSLDRHLFVLQVVDACVLEPFGRYAIVLEAEVVVAGNDHFVRMRHRLQPGQGLGNLGQFAAHG
jgi:glycosyltransferase involved in cell wall biosynthesis